MDVALNALCKPSRLLMGPLGDLKSLQEWEL
jgi:hypothetical protein